MSELPPPEPTTMDEQLASSFERLRADVRLRGTPEGDQSCDNCDFYADPSKEIAYCWHERIDAPVGQQWWCDRWEAVGASGQQMTPDHRATAMAIQFKLVEDQQWKAQPKFGEQCSACLFYLAPGATVSYCWHPSLRVAVGHDHWCQWWEPLPGGEVGGPGD